MLTNFYILYHKSAKPGHIPEPAAPDDLVGSLSAFCVCMPYVLMMCLHKCLEISSTGTNSLYNAFFKINKTLQTKIIVTLILKFGNEKWGKG